MTIVPFVWMLVVTKDKDNIFATDESVYGSLIAAGGFASIVFGFPIYLLVKMVDILSKSDFLYDNRANFPAWQGFFPGCDVAVEYMDGANCAQAALICYILAMSTIIITTVWLTYNANARRLYVTTTILEYLTEENEEPSWEKSAQKFATTYFNDKHANKIYDRGTDTRFSHGLGCTGSRLCREAQVRAIRTRL
jgi:hypothetical protein